MYIMYLSEDRL